MFKSIINMLGASALLLTPLAACTPAGQITTLSVASFEQALKNACNLELPVATAAADVAAFVPVVAAVVGGVAAVADEACTAIANLPPSASRASVGVPISITVRGVTLHVARHS